MSTVINYIDKAGLDKIFQIIAEKDNDIIKVINALTATVKDMKQKMLTIDNLENGFTKKIQDPGSGDTIEKYTNNNKISVGLISPSTDTVNDITKLLSVKEQGIDYTEVPTLDAGEY